MTRDIRDMGHTVTEIHSNRSQNQRKASLQGFTHGRFRIMVATDIAARGIDVKTISLVINFDLPDNSDDYVHRIGRTARAGRSGKAISFVTPSEKADVKKIERLIRKSIPILSLPQLPPERETPVHVHEKKVQPPKRKGGNRKHFSSTDRNQRSDKESFGKKRRFVHQSNPQQPWKRRRGRKRTPR